MKNLGLILCCLLLYFSAQGQVKGVVFGSDRKSKEVLYGAKVKLLKGKIGAMTSEDGRFELILPKELPDTMVVTAIGHESDTIVVTKDDRFIAFEIILYSDQLLPEVIIQAKRDDHSISRLKILYVENLGSGELKKAACCNLSESFETNASVDVNITDAVSGAKKIHMMGLDGVYTQIQMENIPYLKGLESSFGLNSMPGTWIESIQITKGSGNVVNGYESMAGLVNIELKKPKEMEAVFLNAYTNRFGRAEVNMNSGFDLTKRLSTGWFVHGSTTPTIVDENSDGFRDIPTGTNFAVANRYKFDGKKMEAQYGFNAYLDNKTGGQTGFRQGKVSDLYGVALDSKHIDVFVKTGFFFKKPLRSLGVVYNAKYQTLDAQFGNRQFIGEEKRGYVNAIYDGIIGNSSHKFKTGGSVVISDLKQVLDSVDASRFEVIPGMFGEYTYTGPRLSLVTGVRGDYHSIYGPQVSPRLHARYSVSEYADFRIALGKGWRVPNYLIDNISLAATSRSWVAVDTVLPEISWNMGGSFVQRFRFLNRKASLSVDFYHTQFENQMLIDRDADPSKVVFSNLSGRSYSNSFQAEMSVSPIKNLEVRLAYKWLEVRAEYGGVLQQKVMVPRHRGFANIGYETRDLRWKYDITCSVFGKSRLPIAQISSNELTSGEQNASSVYAMLSAQVTHVYRRWEFYLGGENLGNVRQQNPIIQSEDPFGNYFDATRIWGPVVGWNVYAGLRFSIKQKKRNEEKKKSS